MRSDFASRTEVVNNCGREPQELAADDLPWFDHSRSKAPARRFPKDYRPNRIAISIVGLENL
jgi:hypothetical protein